MDLESNIHPNGTVRRVILMKNESELIFLTSNQTMQKNDLFLCSSYLIASLLTGIATLLFV
jgi:hypothetical protein